MKAQSVLREGTRVVNCYLLSPQHGMHGTIRNSLFQSRTKDWTRYWAWIQYDNGVENSEMKKYLCREDEVIGTVEEKRCQ